MIDYADTLAQRLAFDPPFAQRVRDEVDDHLRTAAQGSAASDERAILATFGDVDELAAQFAATWLGAQTRRVRVMLAVVVGGAFAAMQLRLASYAVLHWSTGADARAVVALVAPIDAYAFRCALLVTVAACILAGWRVAEHRTRLYVALSAVAATALVASVAADAVLTGAHLRGMHASPALVIPICTLVAEVGGAALLGAYVLRAGRRMASARACLRRAA